MVGCGERSPPPRQLEWATGDQRKMPPPGAGALAIGRVGRFPLARLSVAGAQ